MTEFPSLEKVSPRGIRKWAEKVKAWANAKQLVEPADKSITLQEYPTGTVIGVNLGGDGSGLKYETVTGAVNGVPATLRVLTDGAGWAAI